MRPLLRCITGIAEGKLNGGNRISAQPIELARDGSERTTIKLIHFWNGTPMNWPRNWTPLVFHPKPRWWMPLAVTVAIARVNDTQPSSCALTTQLAVISDR
jgi:hypothetical protein